MIKPKVAFAIVLAGAAVMGCGGGGGDSSNNAPAGDTASADSVPANAFASTQAFIAFVRGLAVDDRSEPLKLPDLAAPVSDTAEPAAV